MMTDRPAIGASLPFLFSYRDTLFGNGFVVHVEARNGRALCAREEDGWWMYGVNPGGMAAHGDDPHAAHAAFRKTFSDVLLDIAKDTRSFDEFRAQVEQKLVPAAHRFRESARCPSLRRKPTRCH